MAQDYEGLESASGYLFTIGAVFSKLQYLPITAVRVTSNLSALLMYLAGYFLWVAACQRYPHEELQTHRWYTFAEFKDQFTASAVIGSIAMAFSLFAIANPIAFVASAWLMVVSNFLWVVGERNKMVNPPQYRQLPDPKQQETYFNYSTIVFAISVITALSVTGVVFFPISAIYIVSLATILTTGLSLWSFEHILENWFPSPAKSSTPMQPEIPEVDQNLTKMQPGFHKNELPLSESKEEVKPKEAPIYTPIPSPPSEIPKPPPFHSGLF